MRIQLFLAFALGCMACPAANSNDSTLPGVTVPPTVVADAGDTAPAAADAGDDSARPCYRNCYGGWVCNITTRRCEPPPFDGGREAPLPASGPGAVSASGGTVDRLRFGVYGDVRPDDLNEDNRYPRDIISDIMTAFQQESAQFVVATGDYIFSNNAASASAQIASLKAAEANYAGFVGHALGNHECKGWSASNCPNGDESAQMVEFMRGLVPHTPTPYFDFTVETNLGPAKFVFVAANAWSEAQREWLTRTIARETTYTFVLRHHPSAFANDVTGVLESDRILDGKNVTLKMYGHVHEYRRLGDNEVICGNGGGPLRGFNFYGYLIVDQLVDGSIQVTSFKRGTNEIVDQWRVTADGRRAP
ncbi:MAG: metallophosphoesterase [Deltaproteobacteria bacterium]|nr:metallophosphoesterase [Deltaproteobacteria bacterium]